jgi:hypothetical protein
MVERKRKKAVLCHQLPSHPYAHIGSKEARITIEYSSTGRE